MSTDILIDVKGLKKHFKGDEIKALDGVDQQIRKGEVVVVIGPSGSGKSTFLRCLNLLEIPSAGTICFEGTDITDARCNINTHRQKMGMVFQHYNLFPHMTVLKNMTIAPMKLLHKSKMWQKSGAGKRRRLAPHHFLDYGRNTVAEGNAGRFAYVKKKSGLLRLLN